jgi:hypothetical protein
MMARQNPIDSPIYRLGLAVTQYRMGIQEAIGALREGRPSRALAILEQSLLLRPIPSQREDRIIDLTEGATHESTT